MIPISYNLRSLAVRKTTTAAAASGIALVVFTFSAVMMAANSVEKTLGRSGEANVAVILRDGADAEMSSSIDEQSVTLILAARQVARREGGVPDGTSELVGVIAADKADGNGVSNLMVRGVRDDVFAFRREVRIVAGRKARPGGDEVIIGQGIRGRFRGVDLNQSFELRKNRPVRVVGIFEAEGSSYESEVWGDIDTVRSAFGRPTIVSSVRARLRSASDFAAFKAGIDRDRRLDVKVEREPVFLLKQSEMTSGFVTGMGIMVAFFFSIAAIIGAMITMYSAVANRSREIGTLRAMGFQKSTILFSFVIEGALLSLAGGLLGAVLSLCLGFVKFSLLNFQTWSEMVFTFEPTVGIVGGSLVFAVMMGLIGGLFPAVRAARVDVLKALRG